MFEGGLHYNSSADRAVRYIALLGTPIFVIHSLLVAAGLAPSTNYSGLIITLVISIPWLMLGLVHFFIPVKSRREMAIRLIAYHFFGLATLVFVTGFEQPLAPTFALLFIATNIYFGHKGFWLSVASVLIAAILDIIVRYPQNPMIFWENVIGVFAIVFLGTALIGIISVQETRRKALVQSQAQERLQYDRILTIINNLTDAAFSTDENGRIIMYNAACLDLLDTNDSLKGKNIGDLFTLSDTEEGKVNLFEILSKTERATRRDDLNHTYSDGESIRLEITSAPIRSTYSLHKKSQQVGYILIMRDVTKQKSLEEERDEFISVVSHELRTPITIVEGTLSNLDVMVGQKKAIDQKVLADSIKTAHDQVLYLARMVNDLSTLSRAERGIADAPEEIDVTELLHALHRKYQKEAELKKLHLNIDLGTKLGKVSASRLYLEELLQNFVTNAIKYTEKGNVTIVGKRTKNTIEFSVKDSGIGISRSDQLKIFHKFYRSEDYRIRETSGTGLGLYVSAKLSHKLGTHIELKSRLNHGSTFSFELPVAE